MSRTKHHQTQLDWSTATVTGGRLTVDFTVRPVAEWIERLEAVVNRLQRPGTPWDAVKVKRARVKVRGVMSGAEDDLRLFLEGVVQQANADCSPDDRDTGSDARSGVDEAMTERFRSFRTSDQM
ncbi:MAG: hypothetical protein H0W96_03215 [Solirubrobacterales bacterium]|nr:hypothetical protein [Solirubrobacterales bacterium]